MFKCRRVKIGHPDLISLQIQRVTKEQFVSISIFNEIVLLEKCNVSCRFQTVPFSKLFLFDAYLAKIQCKRRVKRHDFTR